MAEPILSLSGLHKHFGGINAVEDMSFDVRAGEVMGLMGPNGAGKTTLINIIAGEHKPDSGKVIFEGNDITGRSPHKICHMGIARTYQIPQPFEKLTILQNIAVAAIYGRGLSKAAAEVEAANILEFIGLEEDKEKPAGDLEEISLKRLELGRVLATGPKLLLIDEIAAGLTDNEIPPALDLLKDVNKMGITIILIEHIMKVMMEAVDRIVVMDEGRKIAEGKPEEVMEDKGVIEAYFG